MCRHIVCRTNVEPLGLRGCLCTQTVFSHICTHTHTHCPVIASGHVSVVAQMIEAGAVLGLLDSAGNLAADLADQVCMRVRSLEVNDWCF
mgnify:CR=1 FL=1